MSTIAARNRSDPSFRAIAVTFCVAGVVVVGQMYATIPLIPQLAAVWGVSSASASWATSAFAIAYACGSLLSGPLSGRFGRRAVMVGGTAAMAVVTAVVPLAGDLATGSLLRAAQGLLAGAFVPMAYAHFHATIPTPRLPLALTLISASMGGTVVVGQIDAQLVASVAGWQAVFWVTTPLLLACAVAVHRVMGPSTGVAVSGTAPAAVGRRWVRLVPLYLTTLLVAGSITAIYTGIQLDGPAPLLVSDQAMLALRISALPALIGAVLLAPRLARFPSGARVSAAFTLSAAAMAATALLADSPTGIGIAMFAFMLGMSTAGPALVQSIGAAAGPGSTTAIAVYGFALNAGGGVGAQLPANVPGLAALALLLAVLLAVASVCLTRSALRKDNPS